MSIACVGIERKTRACSWPVSRRVCLKHRRSVSLFKKLSLSGETKKENVG